MAYVAGSKARLSTSPSYAEAVRARIRCGEIVSRLQKHALGKVDMTPSQVQAAMVLLRKVVPDRTESKVEHGGSVALISPDSEQARMMAEAVIEAAKHRVVSVAEPRRLHDSVSS